MWCPMDCNIVYLQCGAAAQQMSLLPTCGQVWAPVQAAALAASRRKQVLHVVQHAYSAGDQQCRGWRAPSGCNLGHPLRRRRHLDWGCALCHQKTIASLRSHEGGALTQSLLLWWQGIRGAEGSSCRWHECPL